MIIKINTNDGTEAITTTDDDVDISSVLEAHGYDPNSVEYTVEKGLRSRLNDLEAATRVGGNGKEGIAHRIDDLEKRVTDLEDRVR
jgi:hypothetical protein